LPLGERIPHQLRIVVFAVAGHFVTQPVRTDIGLVLAAEFDFGYDQSLIFPEELVHLEDVLAHLDLIAEFVDVAFGAEQEQLLGVLEGDLFFPFVTADAGQVRLALDGDVAFLPLGADAYGATLARGQVALTDAGFLEGQFPELAGNQKLTFDFEGHEVNFERTGTFRPLLANILI